MPDGCWSCEEARGSSTDEALHPRRSCGKFQVQEMLLGEVLLVLYPLKVRCSCRQTLEFLGKAHPCATNLVPELGALLHFSVKNIMNCLVSMETLQQ